MKRVILALTAFAFALVSAALADDSAAQSPANQPQADQSAKVSVQASTKDAFLQFALEKAKQYTGVVEDAVSKAIDVASQEAKPMMEEYLRWKAWYHGIIGIGVVGGLVVFALVCGVSWIIVSQTNSEVMFGVGVVSTIGTFILVLLTASVGASNLMSFIQLQVAPRIYLIEQLRELLK
jgi:hypothetical protein